MRRRCRECGKRVTQKTDPVGLVCQVLGYCRRCYHERFPQRPTGHSAPLSMANGEALLSYDDRRRLTRGAMTSEEEASALSREEELQELIRQQDFYDEWIDYLEYWDKE